MNLDTGGILASATSNKTGTTVTARIQGVVTTIDVARDLSVSSGDALMVIPYGNNRWLAVARVGSAAISEPAGEVEKPPTAKPEITKGTKVISPTRTNSYNDNWGWRTDNDYVYQGEYGSNGNHIGVAFYGNRFASLDGATVTRAVVNIRRRSEGGITAAQDTTLRLVDEKNKPSGAPTLGSSTDGPNLKWGQITTFTLPDSWGQALVDGDSGGIALYESDGSPYVIMHGRNTYSAAFAITIDWTRS